VLGCLLLFGHGGKCIVPSAAASASAGKRRRSGLPDLLEGERRPDKAPTRDTAKDLARADARSGSKGSAALAGKKGDGKGEGKEEAAVDEAASTLPLSRAAVNTSLATTTLSPASQSSMQSSVQSSGQSAGSFQLKARGRLVALEATLWASSRRRPPCTVSRNCSGPAAVGDAPRRRDAGGARPEAREARAALSVGCRPSRWACRDQVRRPAGRHSRGGRPRRGLLMVAFGGKAEGRPRENEMSKA